LGRGGGSDVADGIAQRGLEPLLERGAQGEQRRLPLPAVVDPAQPAVVQLVAEVERELEVLVGKGVGTGGQRDRREMVRRAAESGEQRGARLAARGREGRGHQERWFPEPAGT